MRALIVVDDDDDDDDECKFSRKIVKNCRIIGLNRAKKNKFCPRSV